MYIYTSVEAIISKQFYFSICIRITENHRFTGMLFAKKKKIRSGRS